MSLPATEYPSVVGQLHRLICTPVNILYSRGHFDLSI